MIAKNSGFLYFGNDNGVDGIKDRIAFSPTGRVGIGTISPVAQLDVRSSSGSTYALFVQNTADVTGGTTSIARFQTSNASNYGIWIEGQDVDNSNRSVRIGSLSGIS